SDRDWSSDVCSSDLDEGGGCSNAQSQRAQGLSGRKILPSAHQEKESPQMALGVLNNLSAMYAEHYLNNTNASLQTVLQQLSSGSRINSGADDAAGLSLVNGLQANQTALTQSATNATE